DGVARDVRFEAGRVDRRHAAVFGEDDVARDGGVAGILGGSSGLGPDFVGRARIGDEVALVMPTGGVEPQAPRSFLDDEARLRRAGDGNLHIVAHDRGLRHGNGIAYIVVPVQGHVHQADVPAAVVVSVALVFVLASAFSLTRRIAASGRR